ncbi:BURP domain-containing protein [Cephalotus follicularis]|uniref:BURP domain-containing protein n=1 Tax=Cephalotus follicularis TaxID=3775 RepID=A0A1Q3CLZ2_CEPFO|nr:BURP domain-containing protein [Cephalotus follicularis]
MRPLLLLLFFHYLSSLHVSIGSEIDAAQNPFTPKSYLIRYWTKQIDNDLPKSSFLLSKASPLSAVDYARFSKLADDPISLADHLTEFCSSAKLLCFPDLAPSLESHPKDSSFAVYSYKNFTNYGTDRTGGQDSFKNYTQNQNVVVNSFRRYSGDSVRHEHKFEFYSTDGNDVDDNFKTYSKDATDGSGEFNKYHENVNIADSKLTSYSSAANGNGQTFKNYETGNIGDSYFTSYGNAATKTPTEFKSYGLDSNVMGSHFTNYGENGNKATDTFTSYADEGNDPLNEFNNYGEKGNGATEEFTSYRDEANSGADSFTTYAKDSKSAKVNFVNYGNSTFEGPDTFTGYGQGASGQKIGFKIYGVNNTFTDYTKKTEISFASYTNATATTTSSGVGSLVNKWVEEGKFFRESKIKTGTVMAMPDIRDKMPKRWFLPRVISSKLPFSTARLPEMKSIFHASDNSSMEDMIKDALSECERKASKGETKRCVGSAEDMIDFATSVLGRNVVVRSTENTNGSTKNIMIGSVKGINGGKVTRSVSCHQSLFPYLLYYCHSVPKVRVYEADILDASSKAKINHGVAICHLDTSDWSPGHGAFVALGSSPGNIEVCHWIFENDMTWTIAD